MSRNTLIPSAIEIDEESLGPAMRALTPARQAYVIARVHYGLSGPKAAEMAGFAKGRLSARSSEISRAESVQAAILEESKKLIRDEGPASIKTLVEIRDDKEADRKDRMKAAIELLNRGGFNLVHENHHSVEHSLSEKEMDRRILALCAELGLSEAEAQKMLIAPADFQKNAQGIYELAAKPSREPTPHALYERERREQIRLSPEKWEARKAANRAAQAERMRREYQEAAVAREATEDTQLPEGFTDSEDEQY